MQQSEHTFLQGQWADIKQDIEQQLNHDKAQTCPDKQKQLLDTAEKKFYQKFAAATEFNQARETALAAFQSRAEDMLADNVQIKYQLDELADSFMIVENLDLDNNGVVNFTSHSTDGNFGACTFISHSTDAIFTSTSHSTDGVLGAFIFTSTSYPTDGILDSSPPRRCG